MQHAEEISPFTLVNSQRRYQAHENPLFSYLFDEYKNKKHNTNNPGFTRLGECNQDGRHALFFHQSFKEMDFSIFQNFTLTDLHLSVDRKLIDTTSTPHRKLPPHHISLVYANKLGETITVRIENSIHQTDIYAKQHVADGSINHLTLTSLQKEYLLIQASSAQQLLQAFIQAKQQLQYQLLLEVEKLEQILINTPVHKENTLNELLKLLTQYVRYNGYWDGRIDRYREQLDDLLLTKSGTKQKVEAEVSSSEKQCLQLTPHSPAPESRTKSNIQLITEYIDTWLVEAPIESEDKSEVIIWIKTHLAKYITLNELCLNYYLQTSSNQAQSFIKAQYQRLPTRGSLLEFFRHHLFLGEHRVVQEIAAHLHDTTELYQIYIQFLDAIEQESELRTQRIATAHVLYEISPLYKSALLTRQYKLSYDGEKFSGVLFDLFMKDQFEVFSMYVEQNIAGDTGLQFLANGTPFHAAGAVGSVFYAHPNAARYLDKLFSKQSYNGLPHIENCDLSLYQLNGKNIERLRGNQYQIRHNGKKVNVNVSDMAAHSSITMLRHAYNMFTGFFTISSEANEFRHVPELFRLIIQHTTPEIVIKETMAFFENSFFSTVYMSPSSACVHPEIIKSDSIETLRNALKSIKKTDGESVRLVFALLLDNPLKKPWENLTYHISQQVLTQCLSVFNTSSVEDQILIIRNLNQLSLSALRKHQFKECLALTRALAFCCLSAQAPTIEFHDTLLRAIFMFCNVRSAPEQQVILPYLKSMAKNYIRGLPEADRLELTRNNPSLIRHIMGGTESQRMFAPSTDASQDTAHCNDSAYRIGHR
jgi:hypothetical protein